MTIQVTNSKSVYGTVGLMIVVDHVVISEQGRLMISHLGS